MIVGICGYGNSGSSAVIDYLKEFDEIQVYDYVLLHTEFQIIHEVDGINDLKYYLTKSCDRIACNAAIKRFKRLLENGKWGGAMRMTLGNKYNQWCKDFLDDIIVSRWKGKNSQFDPADIRNDSKNVKFKSVENIIDKIVNRINGKWNYPPMQDKYFSIFSEEDFDSIVKKHICKLFSCLEIDNSKINIIDQLFSSTKSSLGMEFIDGSKNIIVIRDPRDIYATAHRYQVDSRFMPNSNVNEFVKYYRTLNRFIETSNSNNILVIQYEDMIYKYDETCNVIKNFLGLKNNPKREFELFNPLISFNYTNRITLYKNIMEDISIIEKELPEFLYDFKSCSNPHDNINLLNRAKTISYFGVKY